MDKVELHVAYEWICNECGRTNFVSSVIFEFDEETEQEMREDFGLEPGDDGDFCHIPDTVKCKDCGTEYETFDYHSEGE